MEIRQRTTTVSVASVLALGATMALLFVREGDDESMAALFSWKVRIACEHVLLVSYGDVAVCITNPWLFKMLVSIFVYVSGRDGRSLLSCRG